MTRPLPAEKLPTQEELREMFTYCALSGALRWLKPTSPRLKEGDLAGYIHTSGYRNVRVNGQLMRAHRVIWCWYHGEWPAETIDHANGNRWDNRIFNLRPASYAEQQYNKRLRKDNTSGFVGVYWHEGWQKWVPRLKIKGVPTWLGGFDTPEEAAAVRDAKAKEIHGEFYTERGTDR